jgi:hypothetical protein
MITDEFLQEVDETQFDRALKAARNVTELEHAYNFYREESSNADKRARQISHRIDQLRGS